ncbi:hypothetical protein JTE90_029344 [Oedothorax gibbosus]|uniref:Uncharacterized protein n=1 Tax=Oedothorax gibbosus TaxID=931172 RepID=A0AAV6UDY6_9ARAC|nr:hypothetical protein JTE90_029344 [Oedothorax gibbosus]
MTNREFLTQATDLAAFSFYVATAKINGKQSSRKTSWNELQGSSSALHIELLATLNLLLKMKRIGAWVVPPHANRRYSVCLVRPSRSFATLDAKESRMAEPFYRHYNTKLRIGSSVSADSYFRDYSQQQKSPPTLAVP